MDKYTVDLDKVLNDFEYSELTDQHVRPQQNHTYNNRVKEVTKHSINNVFHSLNEYLNTDVSDGSDVIVADNNQEDEEETAAQNNNETINTSASAAVIDLLSGDVTENLIEVPQQEEEKIISDEAISDEREPETVILESEKQEELVKVEEVEERAVILQEDLQPIEVIQNAEEEVQDLNQEKCDVVAPHVVGIEQPNVVGFDHPDVVSVEQPSVVGFDQPNDANVEQPNVVSFDQPNVGFNQPNVVGFDQPVELEEAELNKYLDELEEDENLKTADETEDKNVITRPDSLDLPADNPEPKKDINLIGEPGSTPYNNIYVTNELAPVDETNNKIYDEQIDESSSPSPTFSEDSTGSTTPSTETLNDEEESAAKPEVKETPVEDKQPPESSAEVVETQAEQPAAPVMPSEENNAVRTDCWLGKQAPLWIPDAEAPNCMHCDTKFTVIKRRHHCRACGLVLCSKCCFLRLKLEYLDSEARVCNKCFEILLNNSSGSENSPNHNNPQTQQPNPNNPMEYCSMVPPLQQVGGGGSSSQNPPPTVMVPVGVLKRNGSNKKSNKSVMFCDGIRPGSDLTDLDNDFNNYESATALKKNVVSSGGSTSGKINRNVPLIDAETKSFIPVSENSLPPTVTFYKSDISYSECGNNSNVVEMLKNEVLTFALQKNLYVLVKIINMDCCINKLAWCFSTEGLINVGQDEIVILLELIEGEKTVPKDIFYHINNIYNDAVKGVTVKELGISLHNHSNFLDSKNHSGFLYLRPTFQCLAKLIIPKEQYLIGILIHRWETPWAKIFPLRLILRLGAEYRYYPSPIISTRHRESVYFEIGHTIIKLLADFRNYSYTLQQIRGLTIHMEDKNTTVNIPSNRYDQIMKAINNSSDHILAFGACFSPKADSHLVCIQDANGSGDNSSYNTHAINIQNKPRKVTGASFIVFNGALKSTSGLTAKSSIVEDGLMIQIPPENMEKIRDCLKNMKNYTIQCGCINAETDETVNIIWSEADTNFNVGIESVIDKQSLSSVPSIRVHNGKDYICNSGNHFIRWTEVFIIQNCEENSKNQDAVNISKISESIAKAVCQALVKYLDLLSSNNFHKIGIRATLNVDNVSYSAGSNNMKLPPIYMKSLDNELVPVLHRITANNLGESTVILELIFRILNV